mmetsp:Transcript_35637/g.87671  ORF Transcript_35637/g.87671 Transcript_35637/m.87671 type:complete len:207 (+) Transcript_35637:119-739(+)
MACFGRKRPDFDEEAQNIFRQLNLTQTSAPSSKYRPLDAIWKHPRTGGTLFIGNVEAASNLSMLQEKGITHVVNCTDSMPLYHEATGKIKYHRFDIAGWWKHIKSTGDHDATRVFFEPVLTFVGDALADGKSVMVHCLAGAHRAGTTGCACLMHFCGMDMQSAITAAKKCRPVVDPIGGLPELLQKLDKANKDDNPRNRYPEKHFQ